MRGSSVHNAFIMALCLPYLVAMGCAEAGDNDALTDPYSDYFSEWEAWDTVDMPADNPWDTLLDSPMDLPPDSPIDPTTDGWGDLPTEFFYDTNYGLAGFVCNVWVSVQHSRHGHRRDACYSRHRLDGYSAAHGSTALQVS